MAQAPVPVRWKLDTSQVLEWRLTDTLDVVPQSSSVKADSGIRGVPVSGSRGYTGTIALVKGRTMTMREGVGVEVKVVAVPRVLVP